MEILGDEGTGNECYYKTLEEFPSDHISSKAKVTLPICMNANKIFHKTDNKQLRKKDPALTPHAIGFQLNSNFCLLLIIAKVY